MILDNSMTLVGSINPATNAIVPALVTAIGTTTGASAGFSTVDLNPSLGAANGGEVTAGLDVLIEIMQTLTSAGAATVQFQLVQADDINLTTNVQVMTQTGALPFGLLTAGTRLPLRMGAAAPFTPRRYFGCLIVIAGAVLTNASGQFFVSTALDLHDNARLFKSGIAIA